MDGTFQATAGFQNSDIFQKAVKMAWRCILSVISEFSSQDSNFNQVPPMIVVGGLFDNGVVRVAVAMGWCLDFVPVLAEWG